MNDYTVTTQIRERVKGIIHNAKWIFGGINIIKQILSTCEHCQSKRGFWE